jgi:tetratricopeptide (TPR) repeat protein
MGRRRLLLAAVAGLVASPAAAQLTAVPHSGQQSIVVTGQRLKGVKPPHVQMSDWSVAEMPHVLVFSKGDPGQLARIANNLEKLHFLLSVLLNRVDQPDDTLKLQVIMIGDRADYDQLGLKNVRWQQGPYPDEFPNQIYYDPREDGAVMATAHVDQCFSLVRDAAVVTGDELLDHAAGPVANVDDLTDVASSVTPSGPPGAAPCEGNPNEVSVTAESRLYSTFAQHYLLTYFPEAYPRWYLEGFGEIFANMDADRSGVIEYGREPDRYPALMDKFGHYPVRKVLDGTYLHDKQWTPAFSPYSAWALAHLLFFSPQWKAPLHNYLAAVARGASAEQAAAALGDPKKLQSAVSAYRGTRVSFERLTYPAGKFQLPVVRRLKQSEAVYVRGRLELGARMTIADAGESAGPADVAARQKALADRDRWLNDLRMTAATYPKELADQQLLAEAECRAGNADRCIAAANQSLSISPNDPVALSWKGYGLALEAVAGPASDRAARLDEARSTIAQANRLDTESVLPLLAYYRSYAVAGETPPDIAIDGLAKSLDEVPSTPTTRLLLGSALVRQPDPIDARRILLPVADGAFDPPEKVPAERLLATITPAASQGGASGAH